MTLRHLYESLIKLIKNVIYFITAMDCYYHPKNPLLNFCTNPSCALPLCPKCINIHLSQSTYAHEIVSLNEAVACASEQIDIVCEGLANELRLLVYNVLFSEKTSILTIFSMIMAICCKSIVRMLWMISIDITTTSKDNC